MARFCAVGKRACFLSLACPILYWESLICQKVFKPLNKSVLTDIPCSYCHLNLMFCLSPLRSLWFSHTDCSFLNFWLQWMSATTISSRLNCYHLKEILLNFSFPEIQKFISPPLVSLKSYVMPKAVDLPVNILSIYKWMYWSEVAS